MPAWDKPSNRAPQRARQRVVFAPKEKPAGKTINRVTKQQAKQQAKALRDSIARDRKPQPSGFRTRLGSQRGAIDAKDARNKSRIGRPRSFDPRLNNVYPSLDKKLIADRNPIPKTKTFPTTLGQPSFTPSATKSPASLRLLGKLGTAGLLLEMLTLEGSQGPEKRNPNYYEEQDIANRRKRRGQKCPYNHNSAPYRGGNPRKCGGRSAQSRGRTPFYDTPKGRARQLLSVVDKGWGILF